MEQTSPTLSVRQNVCLTCKQKYDQASYYTEGSFFSCPSCYEKEHQPEYFYIIDGHSMMYRAIYAKGPPLTSPEGEPTKGTFIFIKMLMKLAREKNPAYLAMAVDGPREALLRRKIYPDYKAGRGDVPEEMLIQVERIKQLVAQLGIPVFAVKGYEADDIIATLVDKCVNDDVHAVVVSRDKDLHQLVKHNVRCYDPMTESYWGPVEVRERWGVFPDQVVEMQTLMGDPTDNVPGLDGIGEQRAREILWKCGTVDNAVRRAREFSPSIAAALQSTDVLGITRALVALDRKVPLRIDAGALAFDGLDLARAKVLFRQLGFRRWSEE